jgi:hypothetical protein
MSAGPGKYDAEATLVRERTEAHTVVVIVLGGLQGEGFSVQSEDPHVHEQLPVILRQVAKSIEKEAS